MKFILYFCILVIINKVFTYSKVKQDEVVDEKNIDAYIKKLSYQNYVLRDGIKTLKKEVKEEKKLLNQITLDKEKSQKDIDNIDQKIQEQYRMMKFLRFLNNYRVIPELQELKVQLNDFANTNILTDILQFSESRIDEIKNNAEIKIDQVHDNENEVRKLEGLVKSQSEFKLQKILKNVAVMENEVLKLEKQVNDIENKEETKKIKNKFLALGLM